MVWIESGRSNARCSTRVAVTTLGSRYWMVCASVAAAQDKAMTKAGAHCLSNDLGLGAARTAESVLGERLTSKPWLTARLELQVCTATLHSARANQSDVRSNVRRQGKNQKKKGKPGGGYLRLSQSTKLSCYYNDYACCWRYSAP